MKRVLGFLSLLLSVAMATANPIDFDKAFKESARIENRSRKPHFPNVRILLQISERSRIHRTAPAMKKSTVPL